MALPSLLLWAPLLCCTPWRWTRGTNKAKPHFAEMSKRVQCKECLVLGEQGKKLGSVVATHTAHCRTVPLLTFQIRVKWDLCIAGKISSSSVALQASSGSLRGLVLKTSTYGTVSDSALDIVDVHFWRRQQLGVNLAAFYCTFLYWIQYFWCNIPAITVLLSPKEGRAEESIWILQWGPEMLMWAVRICITLPYLLCSSGIISLTRQSGKVVSEMRHSNLSQFLY